MNTDLTSTLPTTESPYLMDAQISPYPSGDIYTLRTSKYMPENKYDSNPERSNRSTLYGPTGDVICMSPPHFVSEEAFGNAVSDQRPVVICEFVEGTIINLFYNPHEHHWELMTKNKVGANNWFTRTEYSSFMGTDEGMGYGYTYAPQHTFRQMFIDAIGGEQKFMHFLSDCATENTYSFVLNHPASPRTSSPSPAVVYLISTQQYKNGTYHSTSFCQQTSVIPELVRLHPQIKVPYVYSNTDECTGEPLQYKQALTEVKRYTADNLNCVLMAEELEPETNEGYIHTLFVSDEYIRLQALRGNDPNLMYRCLRLIHTPPTNTERDLFRRAFPQFSKLYQWTADICNMYVWHLYTAYVDHFIKKKGVVYPPNLYFHMTKLHGKYVNAKSTGTPFQMTPSVVYEYLCTLTVSELYGAITEPPTVPNAGIVYIPHTHWTQWFM